MASIIEDMPGWAVAIFFGLFILLFGVIIARCEHKPDNTVGYVVQKSETWGKERLSTYEILEPGILGDRLVIIDSTNKFNVGDTLRFSHP